MLSKTIQLDYNIFFGWPVMFSVQHCNALVVKEMDMDWNAVINEFNLTILNVFLICVRKIQK